MKNLNILLLSAATLILFSQCNNPNTDEILKNSETRGNVISTLMNDDNYSKELMDSMMAKKHKGHMMMNHMMSDTSMSTMMMDKMMDKCKSDSSMCKKMMGKTMDMCKGNESKCNMMSEMMCCDKDMMKSTMQKMHHKGMMDKSCMDKGMMKMKDEAKSEGASDAHMQHHQK